MFRDTAQALKSGNWGCSALGPPAIDVNTAKILFGVFSIAATVAAERVARLAIAASRVEVMPMWGSYEAGDALFSLGG
jgi:hypothetical protein